MPLFRMTSPGVAPSMLVALALVAGAPQVQAAAVAGQGTWETTLQGRDLDGNAANGFEAYYDTALDITWLADANQAFTSGFDEIGAMNWSQARAWAANLNVHGTTGWRLPTLVDTGTPGCNMGVNGTDCGYNVDTSASEMAHMYYVTLGNKGYYNTSGAFAGNSLTNTGPFSNVVGGVYWSGVEYALDVDNAWEFFILVGNQGYNIKGAAYYAWAVHSGDVAAVPEPQTLALAMAGIAALGFVARRNKKAQVG